MKKISELAAAIPGGAHVIGDGSGEISALCADSRAVVPGALFFCIRGARQDAHEFAPQAMNRGAACLCVERELDVDCVQIVVKDVRAAQSYMAAEFFGRPADKLTLIGITGTKGKSTTAFIVKAILEQAGIRAGLIGTICSMIADKQLPAGLTTPDPIEFQGLLRQMVDAGVTHVVMEVSAHAIAQMRLEGVQFKVCGFSNLSQDHLDFFGTMEAYMLAKMRLFVAERCGAAVFNRDDDVVARHFAGVTLKKFSFGIRELSEMYAKDVEVRDYGYEFKLTMNKQYTIDVQLHLQGIFNVYNAMLAAALCTTLGIGPEAIEKGIKAIRNVPGRVEVLETDTPYKVILDYAHSPAALGEVVKTIREGCKGRLILLFGCGGDRDRDKRPQMGEIAGRTADYTILTSDNPRSEDPHAILKQIEEGIKRTEGKYIVIEDRRAAIAHGLTIAKPGDVLVLAGKGHETYQEIKGTRHPFDEKVVVADLLKEMK